MLSPPPPGVLPPPAKSRGLFVWLRQMVRSTWYVVPGNKQNIKTSPWPVARGLWWVCRRQRNLGVVYSMDPGSPSANSLGHPGIRITAACGPWFVACGWPANDNVTSAFCTAWTPGLTRFAGSPGDTGKGGLWQVACGLWWGNQQQRNAGLPPGMDPGSRSPHSSLARGHENQTANPPSGLRPPPPRGRFAACRNRAAWHIFFSPSPGGGPGWGLLVMQKPKSRL